MTLPLISAGGTLLILTLAVVGLLARFACTEPAAVESLRSRDRGRLARLLLPAPSAAVEPVRPRRRPEERATRSPALAGGRTLVHARGGTARRSAAPTPLRTERPSRPERPVPGVRPVRDDRLPAADRPARPQRPLRGERPAERGPRVPPAGERAAPRVPPGRRPGGAR